MTFGGTIAVGALVVAALVLRAHGIEQVDDYHQLPLMLTPVFGYWGFVLMCASLGIACRERRSRSACSKPIWSRRASAGIGPRTHDQRTIRGSVPRTLSPCSWARSRLRRDSI